MFSIKLFMAGKWSVHPYRPTTLLEALKVGHELTRDGVAESFSVVRFQRLRVTDPLANPFPV